MGGCDGREGRWDYNHEGKSVEDNNVSQLELSPFFFVKVSCPHTVSSLCIKTRSRSCLLKGHIPVLNVSLQIIWFLVRNGLLLQTGCVLDTRF